ncbi:hypothetical protein ABIA18_000809 [Sinorhizobium fredii]
MIGPNDFPGLASLGWNTNPARPIDRDVRGRSTAPNGGSTKTT